MKRTTRLRHAAFTVLAVIGLSAVGTYMVGCAKQAPPTGNGKGDDQADASRGHWRRTILPERGPDIPGSRLLGRRPRAHRLFVRLGNVWGNALTPDDLFRVATGGEIVMDNGVHFK